MKTLSAHIKAIVTTMLVGSVCPGVFAADPDVALVIKNHRFEPTEIKVPANQRVRLTVHDQDGTPEEFESHALNREKIFPGGVKAVIFIGPLQPGRYEFYGEYNQA